MDASVCGVDYAALASGVRRPGAGFARACARDGHVRRIMNGRK
jgi:hypothetical protein